MTKIILAPSKYVQGEGELANLSIHTKNLGKKPFIMSDAFVLSLTKETIQKSYVDSGFIIEEFRGESCKSEIERLTKLVKENNADVIVGLGGGKAIDTAKAVAHFLRLPVVVVPSVASTSASCSKLSVIYTEKSEFLEYLPLNSTPQIVIADTALIVTAPARLFVAGIGDAMATYFEARACKRSGATNFAGGVCSNTAFALAELCKKMLLEESVEAIGAVKQKKVNNAVEQVVEASLYLSTIGTESGGLAATHSVHNGFTKLKECEHLYHGEKVAFCILVQLAMENAPLEESLELINLFKQIGLPVNLKEMGFKKITSEQLDIVANAAVETKETIHNMPFKVNAKMVKEAILTADKLGSL
jgi:glycerol dehydrogenase